MQFLSKKFQQFVHFPNTILLFPPNFLLHFIIHLSILLSQPHSSIYDLHYYHIQKQSYQLDTKCPPVSKVQNAAKTSLEKVFNPNLKFKTMDDHSYFQFANDMYIQFLELIHFFFLDQNWEWLIKLIKNLYFVKNYVRMLLRIKFYWKLNSNLQIKSVFFKTNLTKFKSYPHYQSAHFHFVFI